MMTILDEDRIVSVTLINLHGGTFSSKKPKDTFKTFVFNNSRSRFILGYINMSVTNVTWNFLKLGKKGTE